jgi:hypothetical protein
MSGISLRNSYGDGHLAHKEEGNRVVEHVQRNRSHQNGEWAKMAHHIGPPTPASSALQAARDRTLREGRAPIRVVRWGLSFQIFRQRLDIPQRHEMRRTPEAFVVIHMTI